MMRRYNVNDVIDIAPDSERRGSNDDSREISDKRSIDPDVRTNAASCAPEAAVMPPARTKQ
jgi:hypothetical protein